MFNSSVLDIAIGLIFTFLAISLLVSTIVEAIASIMKWRSTTLLEGVKSLLNDPKLDGLALRLYKHALVSPRDSGTAQTGAELKYLPSYIAPDQFADALMELTKIAESSPDKINIAINETVTNPQLKMLLKGIADRAAGDVAKMGHAIAEWFDNGMDRVSGVYKRKTQIWSFVIAVIIAGACNISAIAVGKALWQQPMLARYIAPVPNLKPADALQQLSELDIPMGWTTARAQRLVSTLEGPETILGWLITAIATLFGAPFWFDALERIVHLKGSGPSPAEKRAQTGAAH
jgi:hypothetical protein